MANEEYIEIYRDRTGQANVATPIEDTDAVLHRLDRAAIMSSSNLSTPWGSFYSVPESYKVSVTLYAAREYWYNELAQAVTKYDIRMGNTGTNTTANMTAATIFDRINQMIKRLDEELGVSLIDIEGSGDIIVGDLLRRDRKTGKLVPQADDPAGNWLTNG